MSVLVDGDLVKCVGRILACGGVLGLVSPYLSDFKYWGDLRGSNRDKKFLTELLLSATLENDGRVLLITDPESLEREYSRDLLQEIIRHKWCYWIYLFTVPSLHAKLLFRNDEAVVGSANFTYSAFARNIELGFHVTGGPDLTRLKAFLNSLVAQGTPENEAALELKTRLAAAGLWRQESLFDIIRLTAYAHYLLRTTRIHCIWHSLEEPPPLTAFRGFLNSLESDYEDRGLPLRQRYSPITDGTDAHAEYYKEELSISVRKIEDVQALFDQLLRGEIDEPFEYRNYLREYENSLTPPPMKHIRLTAEEEMRIVAMLLEDRIKDYTSGESGDL